MIADERVRGREITLGGGAHGVAVAVDADATLVALGATVADVTDPEDEGAPWLDRWTAWSSWTCPGRWPGRTPR